MSETKGNLRVELWAQCWMAVATSTSCREHGVATVWADRMLKAMDERFPELALKAKENANG